MPRSAPSPPDDEPPDDRELWLRAVAENRGALERIASADLPISEDIQRLLAEADEGIA